MRYETVKTDITVIGGGLAGVCAAVSAARLGQKVALVQNRPMLGGNSSSEVRVWVCGAKGHGKNRYARETGIMGEMFVENQFRNPEGNPYIWDTVVLETVLAEKNIELFLNTDVHEVEADGTEEQRTIRCVIGWMMGSERRIRFESSIYIDCTGDGLVGFLAGAKFRIGREASSEYGEDWAPEIADDITLGSTMLFYTKDTGQPVKYIAPSFAKDITDTPIPLKRVIRSGDSGCHYWWIEWGGEHDIVHDNERIRDELSSVIYGIWDYIKNSGKFDAENMTLEWVGSIPGKREYRRFIGDYVLNQNDILAQEPFEDRVAFGGWSIDLHPPQGMYSTESGSKHRFADGIYHIPFRSLYSVNVSNMLMAGRDISATHVAFGTTRVMATCAVIGEAAGTGAAISVQYKTTPREIQHRYMKELQQLMLRQDASIIGLANSDELDLARSANVRASSTMKQIALEQPAENFKLTCDTGILFPVESKLENFELLLDAAMPTEVEIEVYDTGKAENYVPSNRLFQTKTYVNKGDNQWVSFQVPWESDTPQNIFLIVKANKAIQLYHSPEPLTGVLCFYKQTEDPDKKLADFQYDQPVVQWSMDNKARQPLCFRLTAETLAYGPDKIIDGYNRPYGLPHLWISDPITAGKPEWIELHWEESILAGEIHLTFNDDVNEDLINLHHHRTPFETIPELIMDYSIEVWENGEWATLLKETNNHKRKKIHKLEHAFQTDRIRLVIESTNGASRAEVVEMRVYSN